MSEYPGPGSQLLWRFMALERYGCILWRWEIRTQAGHFVANSDHLFETLTECELDAKANGFVPPEKRPDWPLC
jgi:hypothetical protein